MKFNKKLILILLLWLLIWAGYNTNPQKLDFSHPLKFFHAIRAFFPILAGFLATIFLLRRLSFSSKIFFSPLGFLFLYTLIGIISSIFLSANPFLALYWAFSYFSVLAVLFLTLTDSNSIPSLINLNWIIIFIITIGLSVFFLSQSGVFLSLSSSFWQQVRPFESLAGAKWEIFGMAGTRPTGLGRYAGVAALVALAKLLRDKRKLKLNWFFFFLFSYFVLLFSQARTEILGFVFGFFLIFLLKSKSKVAIFGWSSFTSVQLVLVGLFLFYIPLFYTPHLLERMAIPEQQIAISRPSLPISESQIPVSEPKKVTPEPQISTPKPTAPTPKPSSTKETEAILFTLSGRTTGIWPEAWKLFLKSPLIGFGFQADRIFLAGQHAHNAILHALIQTGIIGTFFFVFAFIWVWILLFKLLKNSSENEKPFLIEIAGVFAFFMIRGITESTGAFFGVDFILLAPIIAYIQNLWFQKSNQLKS